MGQKFRAVHKDSVAAVRVVALRSRPSVLRLKRPMLTQPGSRMSLCDAALPESVASRPRQTAS